MSWMIRFWFLAVVGSLMFTGISCNEAADGYNAEIGSKVNVPADTVYSTAGGVLVLYNFSILRPNGDPGNNIQVQIFCNNGCRLYDKAEGETATIPDLTRLQEVSASSYFVTTSNNGFYSVVIRLDPPSTFGVTTYNSEVIVDIGVASGKTKFTVNTPS